MGDANDERRRMLADLMRTNSYPRAVLEADASLARPTYCEVGAWGGRIGIGANRPAFINFNRLASLISTRLSARVTALEPPRSRRSANSARRTNDLLGKEPAN
jgi:hypothetical protein